MRDYRELVHIVLGHTPHFSSEIFTHSKCTRPGTCFQHPTETSLSLFTPGNGLNQYINNSLHLAQKYARIFCPWTLAVREANSFLRACWLRGTDDVRGQISEHIFTSNGGYCVNYLSNVFHNVDSFENWEIFSGIPQFQLGNIQSYDVFRPFTRERKYSMDYSGSHQPFDMQTR